VAQAVRAGSRQLQAASASCRTNMLNKLAQYIDERQTFILSENAVDLAAAEARFVLLFTLFDNERKLILMYPAHLQQNVHAPDQPPEVDEREASHAECGHSLHRPPGGSHGQGNRSISGSFFWFTLYLSFLFITCAAAVSH